MHAKLIVLEGIDHCGKGTQVKMLQEYMEKHNPGRNSVFRHAGQGTLNTELRRTLLRNDGRRHTLMAETLIFAADLANLVDHYIAPALAKGNQILVDRFWLSSLAYQGYGDGVDLDFVEQISRKAARNLQPDLTIVLDVDPRAAMERMAAGREVPDQYEGRLDLQKRIREGYLIEAKKRRKTETIEVVDASSDAETVCDEILEVIFHHFSSWV